MFNSFSVFEINTSNLLLSIQDDDVCNVFVYSGLYCYKIGLCFPDWL